MESTLSLQYSDFTGEVGLFLGYGRGVANGDPAWSTQQQAAIDSIVRSGIRQFYFPPPLEGERSSYDWSFLKPVATLQLASGTVTVAMPDDFGGLEGQLTVSADSGIQWSPLNFVGCGMVYKSSAQYPTTTGRPLLVCQEPVKGTGPTQSQRFDLRFWPIADQDYTIQFAYYILPDRLDGAFPYCYGGAMHVETILESCLAIAEQRLDDSSAVHSAKFMERLTASVSLDRRMKPQNLGYNRDRSDQRNAYRRNWHCNDVITVNGVLPT